MAIRLLSCFILCFLLSCTKQAITQESLEELFEIIKNNMAIDLVILMDRY